jgi:gas vesicle protein
VGKKSLLIGAAIGYVLGARAGRERYDQIAAQVSRLWNDPKVKSKVDQAQTAAVDTAKSAAASAKDAAANSSTVQSVKDKLPGSGTSSTTSSTATSSTPSSSTSASQPGSTTPLTPTTGSNAGGRP